MTIQDLALALLRATLATSAAACLATLLLTSLRVQSPRTHRVAWLLVILQGWLLFPWTLRLETPPSAAQPPVKISIPIETYSRFRWADERFSDLGFELAAPASPTVPWQARLAAPGVTAWFTGAFFVTITAVGRYLRIFRTLPLGAAPDDPQWQAEWRLARTTSAANSRSSRVDLRITNRLGPLLAFIPWRYIILAPRTLWTALASPEREAILRHELAHLRRRDLWKSLALRALALPQWFNPLAWLAVRRFDEAAEWACDAESSRGAGAAAPLTLAQSLVRTAELLQSSASAPATPGTASFRGGVLSRRVQRLVTPRFKEESTMKRLAVPLALATIAAAQLIRIERVAAEDGPEFEISEALGEPIDRDEAEPPQDSPMTIAEWMAQPRVADLVQPAAAAKAPVPHERKKATLPTYVVEPPDILTISCIALIPNESYAPNPHDTVHVTITGGGDRPNIDANFEIAADGSIDLGKPYGKVHLAGQPVLYLKQYDNIAPQRILERELTKDLPVERVSITLVTTVTKNEVAGQHLVAMDGRVNLGVYGSVFVAGMTIEETRAAIEKKLSEKAEVAEVSVDVLAYNSKVYYIITQGGDRGDDVVRVPITGNETVLDAIANIGGIPRPGDVKLWIARPAPNGVGNEHILPVAWHKIARGISTETNYQLLPGDRLFIEPQKPIENPQAPPTPLAATETADIMGANEQPVAPPKPPEAVAPASYDLVAVKAGDAPTEVPVGPQVVFVSLSMPDGRDIEWAVGLTTGATINQILSNTTYPVPVDLAKAAITLSRVSRKAREGRGVEARTTWEIGWDAASNSAVGPENGALQPGDRIAIELSAPPAKPVARPKPQDDENARDESPAEAASRERVVFFSLRMPDGKGVEWPVEFAAGATIGEVLKNTTYPNPVDFDRANISLSRHSRVWRDGRVTEARTTWAIGWDAKRHAPPAADNRELQAGDSITIDLSPPPATSAIQPNPSLDRAPSPAPEPMPRVGELQVHDVVTVLVDYGAKAKDGQLQSFRIPCEISEIRANGNLCIEGQASIRNADEWWEMSLSGETRREAIGPDRTVSSDSIVNLDIHKFRVRPEAPVFSFSLGFERSGGPKSGSPDAVPPTAAAPSAPAATAPVPSSPIEYKLAILEDLSGDLAEFIGPQNDAGVAILRTNALEPSLRVLTKHKLIKHLGDPRIRTQIDRPAEFNLASKPVAGAHRAFAATQRVKILGHHPGQGPDGRSLIVNLEAMATHDKKRYRIESGFTITEGETALVKLRTPEGEKSGPLYVAVTPEWVE